MKGKIVVIDDTESLLEEVSDLLKMEGYEVFTASNAYKGLTLVNDFAPDVIITDLNMPEMDGFKLISKLKSIKKSADIPIIVLSGQEGDSIKKAFENQADLFLKKPVSIDELLVTIQHVTA